jgi:hypothetical protein
MRSIVYFLLAMYMIGTPGTCVFVQQKGIQHMQTQAVSEHSTASSQS